MLLMLGVLPAQVSSFGAVGGALGSGCAAGEVSLNTVGGVCGGLMKMHHISTHYNFSRRGGGA